MKFRQATIADLDRIIDILKDGANQLAERSVNQWQGDYPSRKQIKEDIENGWAYLVESDDDQTVGAISIVEAPEHDYDTMKGQWLKDTDKYVVIHRVAIHSKHAGKGYATKLLQGVITKIRNERPEIESIRIDTHENNEVMQHLINKMGFKRVGSLHGIYRENEISYVYEQLRDDDVQ